MLLRKVTKQKVNTYRKKLLTALHHYVHCSKVHCYITKTMKQLQQNTQKNMRTKLHMHTYGGLTCNERQEACSPWS